VARGVLLGAAEPKPALQLVVPGSAVAYTCACGDKFYDKRKGILHAAKCADIDGDVATEIGEEIERRDASIITSFKPGDAEAWDWGRKRMSEGKVGFRAGRPT
jgi:hypothetical protein